MSRDLTGTIEGHRLNEDRGERLAEERAFVYQRPKRVEPWQRKCTVFLLPFAVDWFRLDVVACTRACVHPCQSEIETTLPAFYHLETTPPGMCRCSML